MLRFKILVSVVPLIGAAILARLELVPTPRPCINLDTGTLQIAQNPDHADLHVSFTDEPSRATVRVALTDSPEAADFTVVDDATEAEESACMAPHAARFVAIEKDGPRGAPVIYLTRDGPADYRIFVNSWRMSAREAAALIVGSTAHSRISPKPHSEVALRVR
ncbi:hypothetical protein [Bradyrhizobium sp.]|jgi:hypothetical protein|uniref:hypothetical protein n=1 Tax=Bradyrhizobium sp. TaxID=376 RepID=UPI002C4F3D11|nr:hypothetical protein [Bradyrhizobium sp.]HWX57747.1 hypothetical protein [Bradyrhizobium sp.]